MDHRARRRAIVVQHPSVRTLEGHDRRSKWVSVALVTTQLLLAFLASTTSDAVTYGVLVYCGGATVAQALFLAVHELSHNLMFASHSANVAFSMVVNVPLVIPFAVVFRDYHKLHHAQLGVDGQDCDLPTDWEVWFGQQGPWARLAWLAMQIVVYAVRPLLLRPVPLNATQCLNGIVQLVAVGGIVQWGGGWAAVRFLLYSMWLAGGLHPCAGHFLAEHAVSASSKQDTSSYYGPLNWLTWNVGYHVEHHDFPRVPGWRLPHITRIAPEHYSTLYAHSSWSSVLVSHVMHGMPRRLIRCNVSNASSSPKTTSNGVCER